MNAKDVENEISKLLCKCHPASIDILHLCWWENKPQLLPSAHTMKPHPVFKRSQEMDFAKGLTSRQWTEITGKILKLYKV